MTWRVAIVLTAMGAFGCGGGTSPHRVPKATGGETVTVAKAKDDSAGDGVPSRCVVRKGACMPPIRWAEKLCKGGVYQDVALYMFRSGTPWTRFYMRTGLNAVNGWGPTVAEDLVAREEVIPINYRRQSESFQVEGSEGTFDVLRWNGSCVTLDANEITSDTPPRPRHSRVDWRELSEDMQTALLEDGEVESVYQARRRECKGASIGRVTKACEDLDRKLVEVVASYVRTAEQLPKPKNHP